MPEGYAHLTHQQRDRIQNYHGHMLAQDITDDLKLASSTVYRELMRTRIVSVSNARSAALTKDRSTLPTTNRTCSAPVRTSSGRIPLLIWSIRGLNLTGVPVYLLRLNPSRQLSASQRYTDC